jgi:hypothetical protein
MMPVHGALYGALYCVLHPRIMIATFRPTKADARLVVHVHVGPD